MRLVKKILIFVLMLAVTAGVIDLISLLQARINREIRNNRLRFSGTIGDAPAQVIFSTVALGSFRGVVADILWLRSESLKQSGRYFEMVQLAKWIVDLQPDFPGASAFLAWNLAYNVSVTTSDFEQRWQWINEGIKLLRDQAIIYNPDDSKLYYELSWIYLHKLGNILDDANLFYKNKLALEVMNILGETPDYQLLAEVPQNENDFMLRFSPEKEKIFSAEIPDYPALYRLFASSTPAALPENYLSGQPELRRQVEYSLRADMFKKVMKLDPVRMNMLNQKYGVLDWRMPESFALYWASIGLEKAESSSAAIDCRRIITISLYDSFRYGRLLMVDKDNFASIIVVPNLNLVDSAWQAMLDAQTLYTDRPAGETFRTARINFMKEAISILFNYGKYQKAQEYFRKLVDEDGPQPGATNVEEYIMLSWDEKIHNASVKEAAEIVSGLIFSSINYLVYGDNDAAQSAERLAKNVYDLYMSDIGKSVRTNLPPYEVMKREVTENCLRTFPPAMAQILKNSIKSEYENNLFQKKEIKK